MEKIVIPLYKPTLLDNYEEGYHDGFNDGFDVALLMENDRDWVANLCCYLVMQSRRKRLSGGEIRDYVKEKYQELMEQKKSGVSTIFEDLSDEDGPIC